MSKQGMRSDGGERRERRREDWRRDNNRPDKRSNKGHEDMAPESPKKKSKSSPASDLCQAITRLTNSNEGLEQKMDQLSQILTTLTERYGGPSSDQTLHGQLEGISNTLDMFESVIPILTSENLFEFDEYLKKPSQFRTQLISYLGNIGGDTHHQAVQSIMLKIISPDLARSLTWTGRNGKIAVEKLKLTEIVYAATKIRWRGISDNTTKKEITKWLGKCKKEARERARQINVR